MIRNASHDEKIENDELSGTKGRVLPGSLHKLLICRVVKLRRR